MEKLIIEGHVTNENKVFKLFIKHFEYRDTRHVIYDLLISLNDGQAADWVTYCDKIYIKYRTTSVPSGAILEYTFTVYDLSNPSEKPDTAMDRINQTTLSAFSDIVLAIVKAYDLNCNNANERNQEGRYSITIASCLKELYKDSFNSDIDFNNITKYITKYIIHDSLEKCREFPYKDIRVTVEDNILEKTYKFCVCDENSAIGYSAFKTNIRFIELVNDFIKYDDSDFAAKTMITRFCAIVMQIAAAIENNYGKSIKDNEEDPDVIRIVCEAYNEEKSFEAVYNAETGKFTRYITDLSRGTIEYTMKDLMRMYPELISMSIHTGHSNYTNFGFIVFDKSKNIGIGDSIKRSSGHAIEYIDRDKEKREFSTAVRNITREAVNYFLCLYGSEDSDYYDEYHDQIESLANPEGIVMIKLSDQLGNVTDGAVIPGEKFFRVLKADEHGYKNTLSPYLWNEYNPCDIIKDYYRAELYVPGSDVRPFALWHYAKLKESGWYETAELMIISAYDRIESFCKYMYLMNDSKIEYMQDSVVRIMDIISSYAFGNQSCFDKDEFSILGNVATKEAMRFINKEPGLCMSDNEDEGTGFNSLSLAVDDGISPYSQYLVRKGTDMPLEGTGYLINIEAFDWTHTFVNSNSAKIVVERYDGYKMPDLVLWDKDCSIDQCIWRAYNYITNDGNDMTLAMKYNFIVVVREILCQFILRSRKQAHEYCSGAYNQIKSSIEHTLGVKLENL